jgi:acyl transferase domain-containing protein
MDTPPLDASDLSPLKRAFLAIEELETKCARLELARTEPIAIVGMGCRFPGGATSPESFWRLLREGRDAITEVPPSRWSLDTFFDPDPNAAGKMYTRWGGFLDEVDRFDAALFGITPREAACMDPQQRLMLEVTWEALERAGQAPDALAGTDTGVFVGVSTHDYQLIQVAAPQIAYRIDAYSGTGTASSVVPGRVSYLLGLQGPSLAVDTACSSALVAIHLACQSLRAGECHLAIAGGVNVLLSPLPTIHFCRARMMAPDGRCKTFDAAADGYVRGEGCGVVILKRLSAALAAGDPIVAVVRGTAVMQDGRSSGLTAPNGSAQQAVIRLALAAANVAPEALGYVEAHGTGTPLGDPVEVRALSAVLQSGGSLASPVLIGSVKTNVGHLEAAAGMAGLLKVVLALQHGEIPPHLHLRTVSPHIGIDELPLEIATVRRAWPDRPERVAGVSSFGFSGTNAHAILSAAPTPTGRAATAPRPLILPLSARTEPALRVLAGRMADHLAATPDADVRAACLTLATGRAALPQRLAVVGASSAELVPALRAAASGAVHPAVHRGGGERRRPKVAFLFTGQGSQYVGMGRELYTQEATIRLVLDACDAELRDAFDGASLLDILFGADDGRLHETRYTQPALCALECALATLWREWGVEPDAVCGHSVGDFAAACVAGAWSRADALRLVAERALLMEQCTSRGAMAAVFANATVVAAALAEDATVSIAALNSPDTTVIAGPHAGVGAVCRRLRDAGVASRPLKVSHGFHSALMDPVREAVAARAAQMPAGPLQIPLVSNLTGALLPVGTRIVPAYWGRQLRDPVRFADGVAALAAEGIDILLEIGPQPTLLPLAARCPAAAALTGVPSLVHGKSDVRVLADAAATLAVRGAPLRWSAMLGDGPVRKVALPTYPFEGDRHWIDLERAAVAARDLHPLLHTRLGGTAPLVQFQSQIGIASIPYLADHRVGGAPVLPAVAYLEMAAAAATGGAPDRVRVHDVVLHAPLVIDEDHTVQLVLAPGPGQSRTFQVLSTRGAAGGAPWTCHASGRVAAADGDGRPESGAGAIEAIQLRCRDAVDVDALYARMAATGLEYGPAFQTCRALWRGVDETLAEVVLPEDAFAREQHLLHPQVLDGCLHALAPFLDDQSSAYLPTAAATYQFHRRPSSRVWSHARKRSRDEHGTLVADLDIYDEQGVVAEIGGLTLRRVPADVLLRGADRARHGLFGIRWLPLEPPAPRSTGGATWIIVADADGVGAALAQTLARSGEHTIVVPDDGREAIADSLAAAGATEQAIRCVYLRALDAPPDADLTAAAVDEACRGVVGGALRLVQALAEAGRSAHLSLITRGVEAVEMVRAQIAVVQAPLAGLARVIAHEHPELHCSVIDLDPERQPGEVDLLARDLLDADAPERCAHRGGVRYEPRLRPLDGRDAAGANAGLVAGEPFRLAVDGRGLDRLRFHPATRTPPAATQIEIAVEATGLNFRDVIGALGLYPGDPGPPGGECAGRVTAVGAAVTTFRPGDRVMAIAPGSFARYVIAESALAIRVPDAVDLADAATIPIAFLTAWHGLQTLARMGPGDRVLIHAAAGGVGMAAVQLARRAGAEVFATAGSETKRELLRSLGVRQVMDSRSAGFADQVRAATGGAGVTIVLNSLAGEFIPASLRLLAPGGCFVEIGKVAIWNAEEVAALRPDIRYEVMDLATICAVDPAAISAMLEQVCAALTAQSLRPLPRTVFPIGDVAAAFRFMAQARHVGKIVVTQGDDDSPTEGASPAVVRADASYLVTGGLGALGLLVARWLADRGATHIALMGRGAPSAAARAEIDEIERRGARVTIFHGDVARATDVASVLVAIDTTLPPLRGVVHGAGVLDDKPIRQETVEALAAVIAPKALGAWNLHRATRDRALDFFVLFSSVASVIGSPGQAGYAAGNAFLDALAHLRRAEGLPAMSINWGPWRGVGMAAAGGANRDRLWQAAGIGTIAPDQGMQILGALLSRRTAQCTVLPLRNPAKLRAVPALASQRLLADLIGPAAPETAATSADRADLLRRCEHAAPAARLEIVTGYLRQAAERVLRRPIDDTDPRRPLTELGLDSLMGIEYMNALSTSLGETLPPTLLFDHSTLEALARYVSSDVLRIATDRPAAAVATAPADSIDLLAAVEGLSEQEAQRAIADRLSPPARA